MMSQPNHLPDQNIETQIIEQTSLPERKINQIDGAEMILIPAGEFLMGSTEAEIEVLLPAHPDFNPEWLREGYKAEQPQRCVILDSYYIYKTPVTVAQYRKFCEATGRQMPDEPGWDWQDDHPMVYVNWEDSKAYCVWTGASLPTKAQWEKAARWTDGRKYPWGNKWDSCKCQCSQHTGREAFGTSPAGIYTGSESLWCAGNGRECM